eukprot:scaffold44848_cov66-Phaeocystis_antarctica.AAC.5
MAGRRGDAPFKPGAQNGRLCCVHHQLAPFGPWSRARVLGTFGVVRQRLSQRPRRWQMLGCFPRGDDIEASCRGFLNAEDAKRRQQLRARGEACSGHLAQPRGGVGGQLSRWVRSADIPRGGTGEHGAPLASLCQIDGRISSALVPRGRSEITHPPMSTKSSPGRLAHDRTSELCMHSSAPATVLELSAGYWNSPAAHTTYRAVSFSKFARGAQHDFPPFSLPASTPGLLCKILDSWNGLEVAETPTLKSGGPPFTPSAWTETTSVIVRTRSSAALASAFR